nr:uncharacterized protein LOC112031047 [Quercus suber]
MDLLIDSAAGSAMFSFMDGFSEYNQIRMAPRDAEKTTFRTPIGNFYYTVMPFGLKNAGALIGQEDEISVEQPIYYISRTLKDVETRYPRAERACLAIVYTSQRLRHYFLAYELSQYDLRMGTPRVVKSQAIADLLAQFPGEEEFLLDNEVP